MAGLFLDSLNTLISRMEEKGDLQGALPYARRAIAMETLQEMGIETIKPQADRDEGIYGYNLRKILVLL